MNRVLLIGLVPNAVDVTDPALPPGTTHEKIAAGIEKTLGDMRSRGWHSEFCGVLPDPSAEATIAKALKAQWDCVVIGAGVRLPPKLLELFERIVNAVHVHAPKTMIAFNSSPESTTDAAARWLRQL